jgi:GntR family transcriptional regulator
MSLLNKNTPMPLYFQVAENIRNKIAQNIYQPGEHIPTETQLQDEYDVSRETVRKAVNDLVAEGLVEKVRGKGTFVVEPKIVHRVGSIYGCTEEILVRGMIPTTKFLETVEFSPPESMRSEMRLTGSAKVVKLRRLRCADNKPVAILTSYVPSELAPGISQDNFIDGSLYKTLEQVYHFVLSEADEVIEAGSAGEQDAHFLEIKIHSPLLVVNRLTYLENMSVIEKLVAFYRSDAYKYNVKMKGRATGQRLSISPMAIHNPI